MRVLRRPLLIALVLALAAGLGLWPSLASGQPKQGTAPVAIPAARQATNVAIITIQGPITSVTAKSVLRRLKLAERSGAEAIVIELDTPGGELGAALDICTAIKQCPITNTVAWVNPNAYSAGSVIALACREIVCSDPATMGDALPIRVGPTGIMPLPEHERQKATAPLLAEVVDSARRRGHDEYLVQGIVALGVELWEIENSQTHQRVCINRAEYEVLFGSPPPPLRARLASAPAGVGAAPEPTSSGGSDSTPESSHKSRQPANGATPDAPEAPTSAPDGSPASSEGIASPDATPPADPAASGESASRARLASPTGTPDMDFKPASPRLDKLSEEISLGQERLSQRPVFKPSERGKWKLVEYVSDGAGPYTFKTDDLLHFRLAAAKVRSDDELQRFFGASNLRRLDQNWSEWMVLILTNTYVRGILIVVFLIALVMEMFHPGVILPGTVAAAALILLVAPPLLIGMANWWEIAAIGAGILLLAVEILILPGFGIPGVLGMILLFVGLIGTFVGQGSGIFPNSAGAKSEALGGLVTVLTSFISAGLAVYFISKNLSSIPVFNKMVLKPGIDDEGEISVFDAIIPEPGVLAVGDQGQAITPLRPSGKAQFGDRILDVSSVLGYVSAGTPVRVASVDAFQVMVEPVAGSTGGPAGP